MSGDRPKVRFGQGSIFTGLSIPLVLFMASAPLRNQPSGKSRGKPVVVEISAE